MHASTHRFARSRSHVAVRMRRPVAEPILGHVQRPAGILPRTVSAARRSEGGGS